jgi:predicted nucleic acid-binding protein
MTMNNTIVIYDACVLYPAPLHDLLMHLALTDLFQAKWTNTIHDEWMRSLIQKRSDLTYENLVRTRDLMNENVRDCLVYDYENLIEDLVLPDQSDRHVLAAAIKANASIILTFNNKDFPPGALQTHDIQTQYPDLFISNLINNFPRIICNSIQKLRLNLKKPPFSAEKYLNVLKKQKLTTAADKLYALIQLI